MRAKRLLDGSSASILFVLVIAQTIVALDFSLVSIALPSIEEKLGLSPVTAQWILTADIVVYGGFMIVGGRFADNYGERRSLTLGLGLFIFGSLVSALIPHIEIIIAGRAIQGFGAAFIFPATMGLLARTFTETAQRFRALTISVAVQATGVPVGTMIGGYLATSYGGQAAFMLNVIVCAPLMLLVRHGLPKHTLPGEPRPIPITSAIILALGMGLLIQSALAIVAKDEGTRALATYTVPASILVLGLFVIMQRRSSNPLFPLSLFKIQNLVMFIVITALIIVVGKGIIVLSNISFQQGLGFTAWEASLALIPMSVSSVLLVFLTPILSAPLVRKPRTSIFTAFLLLALAHFTLSSTASSIAAIVLIVILFLAPFVSVTGTNLATSQIMNRAPNEYQAVVAGMLYSMTKVAEGLGFALIIAAKDSSPVITDEFSRFSPSYLVATFISLLGGALVIFALKPHFWQSAKRKMA